MPIALGDEMLSFNSVILGCRYRVLAMWVQEPRQNVYLDKVMTSSRSVGLSEACTPQIFGAQLSGVLMVMRLAVLRRSRERQRFWDPRTALVAVWGGYFMA